MDSKSIRRSIGGPEITVNALYEAYPYLGQMNVIKASGNSIKRMLEYYLNKKRDRYLTIPYTSKYHYTFKNCVRPC